MLEQNPVVFLPPLTLLICILIWLIRGRDDAGRKVIIAEYQPPLHLSPAEIGLLADFKATHREISATLVDLAIRGFIQIIKDSDKKDYFFKLLTDDVLGLKPHEQALLNGLFGVVSIKQQAANLKTMPEAERAKVESQYQGNSQQLVGKITSLGSLDKYFYQYVNDAKLDLVASLSARGYFKHDPMLSGFGLATLGTLLILTSLAFRKEWLASLAVSGVILILFARIMQARTKIGKLTAESVEGFKWFLTVTEKDRLKQTQSPAVARSNGTSVELFEKYLPYAIALGIEKDWNDQFDAIYSAPAGWSPGNNPSVLFDLTNTLTTLRPR